MRCTSQRLLWISWRRGLSCRCLLLEIRILQSMLPRILSNNSRLIMNNAFVTSFIALYLYQDHKESHCFGELDVSALDVFNDWVVCCIWQNGNNSPIPSPLFLPLVIGTALAQSPYTPDFDDHWFSQYMFFSCLQARLHLPFNPFTVFTYSPYRFISLLRLVQSTHSISSAHHFWVSFNIPWLEALY